MIKASASYNYINPNFVIQNLDEPKIWSHPVFAIMKNILMRGCPTIPSLLLRSKFGKITEQKQFDYSRDYDNISWDNVIKGSSTINPANDFYNKILPQIIPYSKTFIPEMPISNIIPTLEEYGVNVDYGQVDFYSPAYNCVIEIDGKQHNDSEQLVKDSKRDSLFKTNDIKVIRIPANMSNDLTYVTKLIKDKIFLNKEYSKDKNKISEQDMNYATAIRVELLLTYLYGSGVLNMKNNHMINFYSDTIINNNAISVAIKDFGDWAKVLFHFHNETFDMSNININFYDSKSDFINAPGIKVDLSLMSVYSTVEYSDIYYIRNDYFNYNQMQIKVNNNDNVSNFVSRNYFKVECNLVKYNVNKITHKKDFEFILRNTTDCSYNEYRANQLDIIIELLNNRSVIGVLPTGAGKSLCYQIASLLIPSMTIVVSPLQLLMVDQYEHICHNFGMNNSTYINAAHVDNLCIFEEEQSLITYVSPERFFNKNFSKFFDKNKGIFKIGFIVIDEAHCLSEWGHDFRTSYLCLSHNLSNLLPSNTFLMALTGTASHSVFKDIENELHVFTKNIAKAIFAKDMRRNNLQINVSYYDNIQTMFAALNDNIIDTIKGLNHNKTLVFTKTVNNSYSYIQSACIPLYEKFQKDNPKFNNMGAFAGILSEGTKQNILKLFKEKKGIDVLFATKAFGMGIDIVDIRKTIHYGLPSSMENLYQQMGRAGRDGKPASCYVYFIEEDKTLYQDIFNSHDISISNIERKSQNLKELGTNFYFLQSSNLDIAIEKKVILKLRDIIYELNKKDKDDVDCQTIAKELVTSIKDEHLTKILGGRVWQNNVKDKKSGKIKTTIMHSINTVGDHAKIILEKALYRLYLLGEIEMWNVVYHIDMLNPSFIHLRCTKYSDNEKMNRLIKHIERYESKAKSIPKDNSFESRSDKLVNWSFDTFFIERVKSMKTLYDWCKDFVDSNDFMNKMSEYFSNEPIFVRLVDKGVDIDDINKALLRNPNESKTRIARLLESYENMYALNYVSGITRLRLDEFKEFDGERRLNLSLEYIKDMSIDERKQLFNLTIEFLSKKMQDVFVDCWLNQISEDIYWIYDETGNKTAEQFILIDRIGKILKIKEEINDKLQ